MGASFCHHGDQTNTCQKPKINSIPDITSGCTSMLIWRVEHSKIQKDLLINKTRVFFPAWTLSKCMLGIILTCQRGTSNQGCSTCGAFVQLQVASCWKKSGRVSSGWSLIVINYIQIFRTLCSRHTMWRQIMIQNVNIAQTNYVKMYYTFNMKSLREIRDLILKCII